MQAGSNKMAATKWQQQSGSNKVVLEASGTGASTSTGASHRLESLHVLTAGGRAHGGQERAFYRRHRFHQLLTRLRCLKRRPRRPDERLEWRRRRCWQAPLRVV